MNRRKLLAFLGATPVAAVIPEMAEAKAFDLSDNRGRVEPMLGELRYAAEHAPIHYTLPSHTHTFGGGAGTYGMVVVLKIWDGEKWVNEDSQEGVAVKNKVLRS